MRTSVDALRSIKKYVAENLGGDFGPWEVQLWDEEGAFRYPFVKVTAAGAETRSNRVWMTDCVLPVAIHAYVAPADTASQAILDAEKVREMLADLFSGGVAPRRVPLWDFEGITLDQPAQDRNRHDFLRVVDLSSTVMVNPQDERLRWTVLSLRVGWRRAGRVTSHGPLVKTVTATPDRTN